MANDIAKLNDIEGVMERLKVGRSKVFDLIGTGELGSVKVGARRLVPESALVAFITRLAQDGGVQDTDGDQLGGD